MLVDKCRKWHVCCAVLCYILYAKLEQILEVLWDFHRLFGSRNSPTTGTLHTIHHVYRSMWPSREAKPRFGAALICSTHEYETCLFIACPKATAAILSSIQSANLLSNIRNCAPSKPSIVFLSCKPLNYNQPNYSS